MQCGVGSVTELDRHCHLPMTSQPAVFQVLEPVHCVVGELPTTELCGGAGQAAELAILLRHRAHLPRCIIRGGSLSLVGGSGSALGSVPVTLLLTVLKSATL